MKIKVDSSTLMNLEPNGDLVRGIIVTLAPEKSCGFDSNVDYVLRYFAPWHGLSEDPATGHFLNTFIIRSKFLGSAQSAVGPFWSKLLGKTNLKGKLIICTAYQFYLANQCFPGRGADFEVELDNSIGRINIYGHAITMFRGNFSPEILK
jgi:predicted PhzF superfamily epimerase YddE/YHI9